MTPKASGVQVHYRDNVHNSTMQSTWQIFVILDGTLRFFFHYKNL